MSDDQQRMDDPSDSGGSMCMGNTHPKCDYVPRGKCKRKDEKHTWHKCGKCDKEWYHG